MKNHATAMSLLILTVALIASGARAGNESNAAPSASECERAQTIRNQVAAADGMPREIKEELLHKAATLCPEKGDAGVLSPRRRPFTLRTKSPRRWKNCRKLLS